MIKVFILSMMTHPDVQKKAQAYIDAVVGDGRMPTFTDRPQLTYIDGILKEIMRYLSIVSFDHSHTNPSKMESRSSLWSVLNDLPQSRVFIGYRLSSSAFPHELINDEEYKGYFIPAGTMVIPNS